MSSLFESGSASRRRASDWAGFLGHLAIAAITVVRTPALSLFLLPSIMHMVFAASSFLMRDAPRRLEGNPVARLVAYGGGYGVFVFAQIASIARPEWLEHTRNPTLALAGVMIGTCGVFVEMWAIWHLRFAFSTEPAARRLVTSGPYHLARHPIYGGACLAYLGLLMTRPTLAVGLALLGWAVCVRMRMMYEEAILESAFPEYSDYRRRVGLLFTWPSVGAKDPAPILSLEDPASSAPAARSWR